MLGYQLKVTGYSPIASRYAGFSQNYLIYIAFIFSGAFAGIAGLGEVSGPIGLLYRDISPNYGFTAIIVAFLGRLHPIGIVFAAIFFGGLMTGGRIMQFDPGVPFELVRVIQGIIILALAIPELRRLFSLARERLSGRK